MWLVSDLRDYRTGVKTWRILISRADRLPGCNKALGGPAQGGRGA